MAHRRLDVVMLLWVLVFGLHLALSNACPSVCTCKWKNGKQAVECRKKGLASIPAGIHIDTQVLDLSGNNLQTLPKQAFARASLTNLQKIYLSDCKIGQIDATAFSQLTNLVELDLSDNLLTEVPGISFSHTPALRELTLRGNRLRKIHSDSFTHTPYLIRLDLSMAGIRTVVPSAFQSLSQLEKLKLQGNQISELPDKVVENLSRVHDLEAHDNPWICDCRALPLWKLLELRHVPHPISPSCRTPERVSRKTFHMLREEDFSCPPTIQRVGRVIEGVAGENATIICPVEGQPPPNVLWFKEEVPVINGSVVGLGPQRLYVITEGKENLVSRLIITGAQETDSGIVRCVAENSAGSATANFTLAVTMRTASPAKLDSGHIAGISVGLVVLALIVLVIGFLFLARARSTSSPTPVKDSPNAPSATGASPSEPNPVQKPPRLTDLKGSSGVYGTTALGNPDVISEAERAVRAVNGHLPNGSVQNMSDGGDYTRMEGDSLYPSGMWPEDSAQENADTNESSQVMHEHFNPGYMANDPAYDGYGPVHSTPYQQGYETQEEFDPQIYGYPSDYGLPIPEARPESQIAHNGADSSILDIRGNRDDMISRTDLYPSRDDSYTPRQEVYGSPQHVKDSRQDLYGVSDRPPVYGYRHEVYGSREDVEGAESPLELTGGSTGPPGERPWVPGSQGPPRGGVAVLPPLPNGIASRIKARDSPDEGYQEGTEV